MVRGADPGKPTRGYARQRLKGCALYLGHDLQVYFVDSIIVLGTRQKRDLRIGTDVGFRSSKIHTSWSVSVRSAVPCRILGNASLWLARRRWGRALRAGGRGEAVLPLQFSRLSSSGVVLYVSWVLAKGFSAAGVRKSSGWPWSLPNIPSGERS